MRLLFSLSFVVAAGLAPAADPPVNPFGPAPAAAPTAASKAVRAGEVVTIGEGKFADITVDSPAGASVVWRFYPPVVQRADKLPQGRAIFAGKPGTTYVVTTIVVDFDRKTVTDTEFEVRFAGKAVPPGTDPPPVTPAPKDPPAPPPTSLYFLVVRADGPASPAFTKAMSLPEWDALRAAGHRVKDRTAGEAAALGVTVPPLALPAVVTLRPSPDGKTSTVVRPAVSLPTTGGGVLDLTKGVN